MKRLLRFLKPYRKECVLGPLFKLLEASFELLVPLVIAALIDRGIAHGETGYIWKMGGLLAALALVGLLSSLTAQYFAARAATGFSATVRHELFGKIQSFSFPTRDALGVPALITRLTSDVNRVETGVNLTLRLLLRSPLIVFGAMAMAFYVDAGAAWIFAALIPLLLIVVFSVLLRSMPLYRHVQTELDDVTGVLRENLNGVRVIRAFGREPEEARRFEQKNERLTRMQLFVGRISSLLNPVTYLLLNAALIVLLHTGAIRVDAGRITQGELVALVNYLSQILVELIKLANLMLTISRGLACASRIADALDLAPGMESGTDVPSGPAEALVRFEHVSMAYPGAGGEALSDITFSAARGETIGVIGPTGCGKSTLMHLIGRFYDVTAGRVLVDGVDVRAYDLNALRARIGVVPQKARLFSGTIADNLRFAKPDATDEEMNEALGIAQALDFVQTREGGLQAPVEQGGRNFSGGQRQRLTIARALIKKPDILILDDSASALDLATDAALNRALRSTAGEGVLFLVSQRAASLLHADRIVVLDEGRIAGIGRHESLLKTCPLYREIYYSQFPKEAV